jgi:hypothetical protein
MIHGQTVFGSCPLIETFPAKKAMPGHPASFDDPVKALGVIRAKDVPRSLLLGGIRFESFHLTLLSVTRQQVDPPLKKQILQSRGRERFRRSPSVGMT